MPTQSIYALVLLLAGVALALMLVTAPGAKAACSDPAGPKVDWSGCDKSGATLYNANLTGAKMSATKLTGADLTGATWTDGRICAEGSWDICR